MEFRGTYTKNARLNKPVISRSWLTGVALLGAGWGIFLWGMAGCADQTPEQLFSAAESAAADSSGQDRAVQQLTEFLGRYPQHESSPNALKLLAVIEQQRGNAEESISYYERLLSEYPDSGHGAEAQFMVAYLHEEYLRDLERARLAYQLVIDNYPESELAASARFLISHLGQDPEEWVEFGNGNSPP